MTQRTATAANSPATHQFAVNGITLTYYEWNKGAKAGANEGRPSMVFAHATGFHARVFDAVIEHFANHHVIAIDLRGHGQTTGGPIEQWTLISDDVCQLVRHLNITGAVGIGHSMGAHTLLQCAANDAALFSRLVLFDPVIMAADYYQTDDPLFPDGAAHPSIRRKREFESPKAMMERFAERDPYDIFDPRVFEDYCRHGLIAQDDGTYHLACPPEVEASIYSSSKSNRGILQAATTVEAPTLIIRAQSSPGKMDFKGSPTWPGLAASMPNGTDLHRDDMTHFHPFQDPADAARIIAEFMGEDG